MRDELGRWRRRRVRGELVVAALAWLAACLGPRIAGLRPPELTEQSSGVDANLRAVIAVSNDVAWASGSGGTWLRTVDGGVTWQSGAVADAEALDFRSLAAFDAHQAILLNAGGPARMFRTDDGAKSWRAVYRNDTAGIFFDALAFADRSRGYALGDPVAGRFVLIETSDGGESWHELPGPEAKPGEGAFAASNSCLVVRGDDLWFATGGSVARVFHSADRGRSWSAADAPAPSGAPSRGIFSLAVTSRGLAALVGGDYLAPEAPGVFATSRDGGRTWEKGPAPPGYRSSVSYAGRDRLVATGTSGTDSLELGGGWDAVGSGYNAVAMQGPGGWAVGAKGRVARLRSRQYGP
ncbi:MAG TPA: oxidoreductase [Myxococcales bacterium]|nr:oxidoreductase [Myxococcales bacterium]